tara:strand:+ start:1599 stop:1868 length:270 start_codon:yes stop_codon:yes gene_type:complete
MSNDIDLDNSEDIYKKIQNIDANELISERSNIFKLIYDYESKILCLKDLIDHIDNQIYRKCDHNWDYDPPSCAYDRGSYICTKCRCYKK